MDKVGMTPEEWAVAKSLSDQHFWVPPAAMFPPLSEDDHIRETMATYGLAMCTVQKLEMSAINLLVLAKIVDARQKAEEIIGDPWERHLKETMGTIVKRLKTYLGTDPGFLSDLDDALKLRNMLAHGFFNIYNDELLSFDGRNQVLAGLQHVIDHFESVTTRIRRACEPFERAAGYTPEIFDVSLDLLQAEAKSRDSVVFGVK